MEKQRLAFVSFQRIKEEEKSLQMAVQHVAVWDVTQDKFHKVHPRVHHHKAFRNKVLA